MHTWLCQHAVGEPVDYAARAIALGMKEIAFTDHSPMPQYFDKWRMYFEDLATYVEKVREAQRKFPNLVIKLAMEVDYFPGGEDWIRELTAMYPWDFLIGSVHYVSDTWAIDDPKDLPLWKGRDPYEVWEIYFDRLSMAAKSGLFEIIGHADLPKKFGIYPGRDCTAIFERFLEIAQKSGVALDINTAGLRKDCKEIYPSRAFMQLAAARRIPITFGSDAHDPQEVGYAFDQAVAMVRELGYTHYCRFAGRQRFETPIEA